MFVVLTIRCSPAGHIRMQPNGKHNCLTYRTNRTNVNWINITKFAGDLNGRYLIPRLIKPGMLFTALTTIRRIP